MTFGGVGYFNVANTFSNPTTPANALTLAAVFKPTTTGTSSGAQFWQNSGLIGNEQGGAVADWGLSYGNSRAIAGIGGPDTSIQNPVDLALNQTHVAVQTWNNTGLITLYVDGVQVAQSASGITAPRTANGFPNIALGANVAAINGDFKPFVGDIAELRVYNDTTVDPLVLSSQLIATYAPVPEPGALALLGLAGLGCLRRRRKA